MYRICAVIVTFNRKDLLVRNLDSLLKQKYPLDILIYDNASTDGTFKFLCKLGYMQLKNITFIHGEKNIGGSGGFCNGEKIAIQGNYDFLWLMDDDGYCINENTLVELVKCYDLNKKYIMNSYIICDERSMELTFNLGPYSTNEEAMKASKNNIVYGYGNPYNGTLVPRKCFEEIGFTDERMFIYGDENDFMIRSEKAGYEWITPLKSLYFHPINRNIEKHTFLGYEYDSKDQPIWKFYLEYRNTRYLGVKHFDRKGLIYSLKARCRMLLSALHSKDKVWKRIKWGWIAINDGEKQYFERQIPFKE